MTTQQQEQDEMVVLYDKEGIRIIRLSLECDGDVLTEYIAKFTPKTSRIRKVTVLESNETDAISNPFLLHDTIMQAYTTAYTAYRQHLHEIEVLREQIVREEHEKRQTILERIHALSSIRAILDGYGLSHKQWDDSVYLTFCFQGLPHPYNQTIHVYDIPYDRLEEVVEDIVAHPYAYACLQGTVLIADAPLPSTTVKEEEV